MSVRELSTIIIAALAATVVPRMAMAGISAQGISCQGISAQGISCQGISAQGISCQGISCQGISAQGISCQGISAQGSQMSGVVALGTDLYAEERRGVEIGWVQMRGTTAGSPVQPAELTSAPGMSTGEGDTISVGGDSAVGHYAVAHLVDAAGAPAEDLDLYVADRRPDPIPNLLHRGDAQINEDVSLYTVFAYQRESGRWVSLCGFDANTGGATAMALGDDPAQPSRFVFACTATGVASKCARGWGFAPWRTGHTFVYDDASGDWVAQTYPMRPLYEACKVAARAAYCQDRRSFTRNGTLIDLYDTRQLVWPNAVENPFGDDPASRWMLSQELFVSVDPLAAQPHLLASALQRTRYRELSPVGQCADLAYVDRLEQDRFEDGRWASPLTGTPRIQVFSPNYCAHSEHETGAGLAWDCSPCTTAVCKKEPRCCRVDGGPHAWDALCAAAADLTCDDPPGRVWPRDLPAPATVARPSKLLLGPVGAVERVGGEGEATRTVAGWACDPEWPGAAVQVAVYGGAPRDQAGSVLLGVVAADRPLAAPLAREVSATCDGTAGVAARHGFSFTLPPGGGEPAAGRAYFYALDAATADGPAAPPTLLRNGIVAAPSSAPAAPATVAAITTGWIEAPASGTYTFSAAAQPGRLWVNGQRLIDWWDGAGPTAGSIALLGGGKYHLRWDRLVAAGDPGGAAAGVTWLVPPAGGGGGQTAIPPSALYRLPPAAGRGLAASYFASSGFAGAAVARIDAVVDVGAGPPAATRLPEGVAPPSFSVVWEGELAPLYSEPYTFVVTSAGSATLSIGGSSVLPAEVQAPSLAPACGHDICALGGKLAASTALRAACHPCVDEICARDPFCCDGGYVSYYASEPEWDAKCVAEVRAVCGLTCQNPLPSPTTRQRASLPVLLQAGVRYSVRLSVDAPGEDPTTQLLWESTRQAREVVPAAALFAAGAPEGGGAGLNVTVFATHEASGGGAPAPDFQTVLATGPAPDLSLAPPPGATGAPPAGVLAASEDAPAAAPAPPAVVWPRAGDHVFAATPAVRLTVIGGVHGGSVRVQEPGAATDVVLPLDAGGRLDAAEVPLAGFGTHTLSLVQRSYAGATCDPSTAGAAACAESPPLAWTITVAAQAPAAPPLPSMSAPRDPTSSPDPTQNVFQVGGRALPGPVQVCDRGGAGTSGVLEASVQAGPDGAVSGRVRLTAGTAVDPDPGWHKLSLSQDGCATSSNPVFVSVGVRPPTVEFPRSGAPVDCSLGGVVSPIVASGTLPYAPAAFGPLVVGEELGRLALGLISASVTVDATPRPDGSFGFVALLPALPLGKHLLYFFQAPPPPAGATPAEVDAHYRAFASIAATPASRIVIALPPPPLGVPAVAAPIVSAVAPSFGATGCALALGPACALAGADVVVRDGSRTWTTRASSAGDWQLDLTGLTPGWHHLTFGQVVDAPAGGGWVESCASQPLAVGLATSDLPAAPPTLTLPAALAADATSLAGAALGYTPQATSAAGAALAVACAPAPGATFPIGVTDVLCTAADPATGAVAVGSFKVTVTDGPPVVTVPAAPLVAEAQSALGALVGYAVTASDAVSGPLPVDCVPSASPGAPALFPLGDSIVTCHATDGAGHTTTASFVVRVRDTVAPVLTVPASVAATATSTAGAAIAFAATASDTVDPAPHVTCAPASGGTFPRGPTTVACDATDASGNHASATFPALVTVAWSNLLSPIDVLGLSVFTRILPISVQFTLAGPSAPITNLPARLFLAPVAANGQVGAEIPAPSTSGVLGNLFAFVPLTSRYLLSMDAHTLAAGVWQLRVDLGDGVVRVARIRLI